MKILVCGGRTFADFDLLWSTLDVLKPSVIINGGANGADTMSSRYAQINGIPTQVYMAQWSQQGKKAGILRNIRMLEEGKPDLVVAFPGGAGTAHMVSIARRARVPVREV